MTVTTYLILANTIANYLTIIVLIVIISRDRNKRHANEKLIQVLTDRLNDNNDYTEKFPALKPRHSLTPQDKWTE